MHENRIDLTDPFLKKADVFPLRDLYKEPCSVVRAESDGSIYTYQSPHSMNVFLTLRYGRLYLNWVFAEDEDSLRLFEYNTEFPYTGTIVCSGYGTCTFENGQLTEEEQPDVRSTPELSEEVSSAHPEMEPESFIRAFCSHLHRIEEKRRTHTGNLSHFFRTQIPLKNKNLISDDFDLEKLQKYAYSDHIEIQDEYETAAEIVLEIAKEINAGTTPPEYPFSIPTIVSDHARRELFQRLRSTFKRSELNFILQSCSDCTDTIDVSAIPDGLRVHLLKLLALMPSYSSLQQAIPASRADITHSRRRRRLLAKFLASDDLE